jgi:hypothetical protein
MARNAGTSHTHALNENGVDELQMPDYIDLHNQQMCLFVGGQGLDGSCGAERVTGGNSAKPE